MIFTVAIEVNPDDPEIDLADSQAWCHKMQAVLDNGTAREAIQDGMQGDVKMFVTGVYLDEADPTYEEKRRKVAEEMIKGLAEFTEKLASGEPIPVKVMKVEHTPDGPLTTMQEGTLDLTRDNPVELNDADGKDDGNGDGPGSGSTEGQGPGYPGGD